MSGNYPDELPGLFWHFRLGKYYRSDSCCASNPALIKLISESNYNDSSTIVPPKITNVVSYVNNREIKPKAGINDSKDYLRIRCFSKREINNFHLDILKQDYECVDYIKGSEDAIYGSWTQEDPKSYTIGFLKFQDVLHEDMYFRKTSAFVVDLCEGLSDDIIVVHNCDYVHNGVLVEQMLRGSLRIPLFRNTYNVFNRLIFCSCSSNRNSSLLAFGKKTFVGIVPNYNEITHMEDMYVEQDAHIKTLAFNSSGNMLTSGTHTGKLYIHDIRTRTEVLNLKLSNYALIDITMLESHRVILGGVDDVLCELDVRNKKIVAEFYNHKQQVVKREPMSISNNMLCAVGSDKRLRIWNLYGGNPIYEMKPLKHPHNKINGWLRSNGNKTELHYFEGLTEKKYGKPSALYLFAKMLSRKGKEKGIMI